MFVSSDWFKQLHTSYLRFKKVNSFLLSCVRGRHIRFTLVFLRWSAVVIWPPRSDCCVSFGYSGFHQRQRESCVWVVQRVSLSFMTTVYKRNPANRIRTSDLEMPAMRTTTVSRSTNWAITGYTHGMFSLAIE